MSRAPHGHGVPQDERNFGVAHNERPPASMSPPLINVADYARAARAVLAQDVFDYYEGGALDEITLSENAAAWGRVRIWYRVLAGVGPRQTATTVLGQPVSLPVLVAPTAFHKLACPEGELASARAARRAGTLFVLSSLSILRTLTWRWDTCTGTRIVRPWFCRPR